MKVDESTQLFLLLAWVVTVASLIAAIWLFRDIKQVSDRIEPKDPPPLPILQSSPPNKWGFKIPPPPPL